MREEAPDNAEGRSSAEGGDLSAYNPSWPPAPRLPRDHCYAWPASLIDRPRRPFVIYLDLNHWIGLARASVGRSGSGCYADVLTISREAVKRGDAIFPLGETHYAEVAKIRDPRQRQDLAAVMEELSGFRTLLSRSLVIQLEVDAALPQFLGPDPDDRVIPLPLLGRGVGWAFGMRGGLRVRHKDGGDATEETRRLIGADRFDGMMRDMELKLERSVLAGPTDEEEPALRALGWRPEGLTEVAERRAEQEREEAATLSAHPRWRRGRLRDVIAVRELTLEIHELMNDVLEGRRYPRGTEVPLESHAGIRAFTNAMPSVEVAVSLKTAFHRNPEFRWSSNDIFDIDALSVAVPYCDGVVTEKHAQHVLTAEGIDERVGTLIARRIEEITDLILKAA